MPLRIILPLSFLLLLLPFFALPAQTPDPMSAGQIYVVAFPDTTRNTFDKNFQQRVVDTFALYIYSAVTTTVTIRGPGSFYSTQVQARQFKTIFIDDTLIGGDDLVVDRSGESSRNVFRVECDAPVILYCSMTTRFSGEMWSPLPVEAWGREYVAIAPPGEIVEDVHTELGYPLQSTAGKAPAEITIVTAYENTHVSISSDSAGMFEGSPSLSVVLAANRAYQVQSLVDTLAARSGSPLIDLTGVRIVSSKPIGVMSGATRSNAGFDWNVGITRNTMKTMMTEWLAPVEQHGRRFVALPTMDDRVLTGQPGEKIAEKRQEEDVRIVASGDSMMTITLYDSLGGESTVSVAQGEFYAETRYSPRAYAYRTSVRAQGVTIPWPVIRNVTTSAGWGSFDTWAGFMTTMTPREQWGTFTPWIAPVYPPAMKHYVNIVTDTLSADNIYDQSGAPLSGWRVIPGTDLCWTTRSVTPGLTRWFRGTDSSVRFAAYAYGLLPGHEEIYPYSPVQYQEYIALSYGYPIAPRRAVLAPPDSLRFNVTPSGCDTAFVEIDAVGPDATGFRSIALDTSSRNTRFTYLTPADADSVPGETEARLRVTRINSYAAGRAEIVVTDRTGAEHRMVVDFAGATLGAPATLDFGDVTVGDTALLPVVLVNTDSVPRAVSSLATMGRVTIIAPQPPTDTTPIIVQPGDSITVQVQLVAAGEQDDAVRDSLVATAGCGATVTRVTGRIVEACQYLTGVDFGRRRVGTDSLVRGSVMLCNTGLGTLRVSDAMLVGGEGRFTIDSLDLLRLRSGVTLLPAECITVGILFDPSVVGVYTAGLQIVSNATCGDTGSSVTGIAEPTVGVSWSAVSPDAPLIRPTPAHDRAEIVLRMDRPSAVEFAVADAGGEEVMRISRTAAAGESRHQLDLSALPAGLYYCTIVVDSVARTVPLILVR